MDLRAETERHPDLVARVDARPGIEAGSNVSFHLDLRKVHVFAPGDDGANLSTPPGG